MKKLIKVYPYILIVLFSVLMFYKIFRPGFLIYLDNPYHLSEFKFYISEVIQNTGWIYGWFPHDFAGFPLASLYPQIGFWLISIMNLIFKIDLILSYKILVYLAYLLPTIFLYTLLKRYHKTGALFFTLLYMVLYRDVVLTILGGMWTYYFGLGFFILFYYFLIKYFENPDSLKLVAVLSLILSLTIFSHPFAAIGAVVLSLVFLLVHILMKKQKLKRIISSYTIIYLLSFLTTIIFTFQLLLMDSWSRSYGFGLSDSVFQTVYRTILPLFFAASKEYLFSDFISAILSFNLPAILKMGWTFFLSSLPQLIIFFFAVIGIVHFFKQKKKDFVLASSFIFIIITLILSSGFWHLIPSLHNLPILKGVHSYRFFIQLEIALLVFAVYGLKNTLETWNFLKNYKKIITIIVLLFFIVNINYYLPEETLTRTSENTPIIQEEILPLWNWVKNNVNGNNERIIYQHLWDNVLDADIEVSSIYAMSSHYTGVSHIGGWSGAFPYPLEGTIGSTKGKRLFGKTVSTISNEELVEKMELLNGKYIVSSEDSLKNKLKTIEEFEQVYEIGHFTVFKLKDYEPSWIEFESPAEFKLLVLESQKMEFYINTKTKNEAVLKFSQHPFWSASINEENIEIKQDEFGLMKVNLPEGEYILKLNYNAKRVSHLIISLIGILLTLMLLIASKWRK
ncbi:hypothetical protein J4413_00135 [Candidatus Woesearchaeota archaeon]|nr:hypothetical protein [Candidatus Woesearchaeota archaeon]